VTISATLAAQGGVGVVFENLRTAFGTNDELMALIRIAKDPCGDTALTNSGVVLDCGRLIASVPRPLGSCERLRCGDEGGRG
jgi:hypothetical protein